MTKRLITLFMILLITITCGCGKNPVPKPGEQSSPIDSSALIGEDKAKEIALKQAGISKDGAVFDRTELDRENGILQYEIEFSKDRIEYDVNIKADDGTVLFFEKDYQD